MKILIATASADELRWAVRCGIADGALVSPALLDADGSGGDVRTRALEWTRLLPGPVYVATGERDAGALYHEARELSRLSDQLVIEMPLDVTTLDVLQRAVSEGCRIAASMVFNVSQALLAAKAGALAVLVPVTALDALGLGLATTLADMRAVFDRHHIECEIIGVFPLNAAQVAACALAGAHAVVVDPATVRDLVLHPLNDRTLDAMLPDLVARSRHRVTV